MPVFYKDKSQNPLDKCITKEDLSENSIATMFSGFIQEKNVDTMKQIFQGMVGNGEVFTKEDLDLFVNNALKPASKNNTKNKSHASNPSIPVFVAKVRMRLEPDPNDVSQN